MAKNTNQAPTGATEGEQANQSQSQESQAQTPEAPETIQFEISAEELREAKAELEKMTPERFAALMAALEQSEEAAKTQLGEAAVVIFGKLKSQKGAIWSLTVRGANFAMALDHLAAALTYARTKYKLVPCDTAEPPPANPTPPASTTPPASPGIPSGAPMTPPSASAPAGAPPVPPTTQPELRLLHVAKVVMTPVVGGKVTIAFYSDERKQPVDDYPSLTNTMSVENAIGLFSAIGQWTAQYFAVAQEYMVNFKLVWKEGRANPKTGKPYKDIVRLEL